MKTKGIKGLLLVGVCFVLVAHGPATAVSEKDEVNGFYKIVLETLKNPKAPLKSLVALVERNPGLAERCLAAVKKKNELPGKQAAGLRLVHDDLQAAILLTAKPPRCDDDYLKQVLGVADRQLDKDDRIFCLERVVGFCPRDGEAQIALGDLYLEQRRCGCAAKAYKNAVDLLGNEKSRKLLEVATNCEAEYQKQTPIQLSDVKDLLERDVTMSPLPEIYDKARLGNSIQRQVLFDEWSSQIKEQFLPDLKVIGEALKEDLSKNAQVRLVIEGHTDKRGLLDRNMKLSRDRAQAIKNYLVQKYGIDPSQLVTEGYGPTRPYSPDESEGGWALNRRVEFKKFE